MVDSDARGREVLVQRMRSRGLDTDSVETAAEAVGLLSVATYDFVLMEVVLPHDGALAIMAWLQRMTTPPRCIVMSGVADLWQRANPGANVAGILQKPFTIEDLLQVLGPSPRVAPPKMAAKRAVVATAAPHREFN